VTFFTWQIDGNSITIADDTGEKIGEIRPGVCPSQPEREIIGIHWHGYEIDWGLFQRSDG